MKKTTYLMGIDNGGTVTKAALYDTAGNEIAVAAEKSPVRFPHAGHAEKDMRGLWAANVRVIGEVARKARIAPGQIAAVGVTGHGNGMYLVDAEGEPAWGGIGSADSRAGAYVRRWCQDGTADRVRPRTCQSLWAGQPAALLAWFGDRMPEVLDRTRWIFMCKDYIRFRLTGEAFAEVTDASGTSLLNVRTGCYDPQLLAAFGITQVRDKLPPLRRSAEICGCITKEAAAETGLREGTPVAGGLFDIDACAIASGVTDSARLCLVAGTWSINEYVSAAPVESPDLFMTSMYCMPGRWLITEASATSASNLEWVVAELMRDERFRAEEEGRSVFARCSEMVSAVAPEACDVVFLPFLYASNEGPDASAAFVGMHGWHGKGHLLRAVYEGVAFSHKTHVDRLLSHRDAPCAARIAGGAARSDVWVQMFADVLQLPIEVTACEELGAMGAAITAGIGVRLFDSFPDAAARMVRTAETVMPRPASAAVYRDKYARYRRVVEALRGIGKA